ncbi:hypothetical protein V7152_23435 [Neobacillus drentensis]|uniref:hypothetical protein n=1 Tax=Neobacillus drentensis TaxID=220684 RepID=UPI003000E815
MSLTSKINGKTKRDKEFREILLSIEPNKEDYYTLSKKIPFSDEYSTLVQNVLPNPQHQSSLVGIAFDYLARFKIAQLLKRVDVLNGMVSLNGFKKLWRITPEFFNNKSMNEPYLSWMDEIRQFINDDSISTLYEIAVHLAKLEQIVRTGVKNEDINVDYLLFEPAPEEVINDLDNLIAVFEEKFMIPEIINKKSEVVFNPKFGVGSALVSGADADIFIDGTLYDFKTTKDQTLAKKDNLQLIGYFILNELAIETSSDLLDFQYEYMIIKRIAFYKARFGEIEYYDADKHLPYEDVKQKLKEIAEHFKEKQGSLNLMWKSDIDGAKEKLEQIRNWDV